MAYATQDDLSPRRLTQRELAALTSDDDSSEPNADVVSQILTEASGMIDSYCRLRYAIPLQASEQIKGICLDIALYSLFSRRRRVDKDTGDRYAAAVQFLRDVSTGKAALDQPASAAPQTSGGPTLPTDEDERFSDDNLKGFA